MAYAVSKWPASGDPRSANYNYLGWASGATPPYHWLLKTSEALPPFDVMNAGLLVPWLSGDVGTVTWQLVESPGQPLDVIMSSFGWDIADSPFPPDTQQIIFSIDGGLEGSATGDLKQALPTAIREQGPFEVAGGPAFNEKVPNPITIIPAKWDY